MNIGAKGIDISTWQHPNGEPIDWEAVRADGVTFAIVKATQGTTWANPWLARDLDDAFAAGLFTGAYHYYEAGNDPTAQAAWFKQHLTGLTLDLHAWLDYEVAPQQSFVMAGQVNQFLEAMKPERPGCGLYASLSMWTELQGANVSPPALWVADWGGTPPKGATIWQESEQGQVKGVPGSVDLDRLMSTRGINLPSTPPSRPTAQTAKPVVVEHDPEPEVVAVSASG